MTTIRKFYVSSNIVFEQVRGGCRAVSPVYTTREAAEAAMSFLRANPHVARVKKEG